ncbi:MmpS family transport accessory protein [Pedobacter insulae]|uniref:Membrane protein n=1 Tax=Pedobacter insulae TaxID=414048 RepID=A0A1I2UX71_9SPHI|nr:MmpS family transport accessory protein [Pedobacter insulae]SFG80427.1 membrane protein [Pedobacter insulae]
MKKLILTILTGLLICTSCKKDSDKKPNTSSRVVRYELTGNFTGTLFVAYTTANGGTSNDEVTSLPWTKEVTYSNTLTASNFVIVGNGGVPGQKVTVLIKRGGNQVGPPLVVTANSSGAFSEGAPPIVF